MHKFIIYIYKFKKYTATSQSSFFNSFSLFFISFSHFLFSYLFSNSCETCVCNTLQNLGFVMYYIVWAICIDEDWWRGRERQTLKPNEYMKFIVLLCFFDVKPYFLKRKNKNRNKKTTYNACKKIKSIEQGLIKSRTEVAILILGTSNLGAKILKKKRLNKKNQHINLVNRTKNYHSILKLLPLGVNHGDTSGWPSTWYNSTHTQIRALDQPLLKYIN